MKIRGMRRTATALFFASAIFGGGGCATLRPRRPPPGPPTLAEAYDLLSRDRPEEAAAVFSEILQDDPSDARARLELAYVDIRLKRWSEAVDLLDAAIDENPGDPRLRMERAYARQALGDFAAAADDFTAVAREPGEFQERARGELKALESQSADAALKARVEAFLDAGYDDLRRGDKAGARAKFEAALSEEPGLTEVAKQLGYMSMA
ncbi:MAG TPA: tetratricopeptide repeat protein, partial [Elusimicrobiota bacterium]|nr:tetratricopeptide repeat protein [Elusimicrobiota bacterium]